MEKFGKPQSNFCMKPAGRASGPQNFTDCRLLGKSRGQPAESGFR